MTDSKKMAANKLAKLYSAMSPEDKLKVIAVVCEIIEKQVTGVGG